MRGAGWMGALRATWGLENRYNGAGRCIGRLEHKLEVLDSLGYFCAFIFSNI